MDFYVSKNQFAETLAWYQEFLEEAPVYVDDDWGVFRSIEDKYLIIHKTELASSPEESLSQMAEFIGIPVDDLIERLPEQVIKSDDSSKKYALSLRKTQEDDETVFGVDIIHFTVH